MRRLFTLALLTVLLVAGISAPRAGNVSAVSQSTSSPAKKVCKTKKVHGKKKKVCTTVKRKPKATPTPTLTLAQQVDSLLTSDHFSGSIFLEKGGQILLEKSYGMADRASNTPNTPQTRFPIFGINYFMAAVGILKLQEEGKLSVQDKLCSYLSDCPAAWQPITLEELLTSTSGIPDYDWTTSIGGTETTMAGCQAQPLAATPGQHIIASDCSSNLLNTVIEKVSGLSWSDFMQQTIFGPAGMTTSGRMSDSLLPPQRARGYMGARPAPALNYNAVYLAYSTLEDVYRLDTALLAGKILSRSSLDQLFTPRLQRDQDANGRPLYMGYGGTFVAKASSSQVSQVIPTGGSGDWGFAVDDFFSPDNGTVGILLINDTAAFTSDDEGGFWDLLVRPALFSK
jgi:CubicO group peptidase (beta-lactamase class C family)